ncbi:hypothetical protein CPB86DRAFT_780775 [Serendipita vermifera]|nr:hypothetical protein CPB86DRAFT_780775 [Serendipita vermifera]
MDTEKIASIIAALDAGKIPSQKQINEYVAFAQQFIQRANNQASSYTGQAPSSDVGRLTENGALLLGDVNEILEAYKDLANEKNGDDIIQEVVWNLTQADVQVDANADVGGPESATSKQEAKNDSQALAQAIRGLGNVFIGHLGTTSSPLISEFLSFLRLSVADVAESVEGTARSTKDNLRSIEQEVQEGQRDSLGREKGEQGAPSDIDPNDPKVKFEKRMDTAKYAGSSAIGATQQAKSTATGYKDKSQAKVLDAFDRMIVHASNDPEYQKSLDTIANLLEKWMNKSLDTADQVPNKLDESPLDGKVSDPNKHLSTALSQLNTFVERLAGGKSTKDIVDSVRKIGDDIRNHSEARQISSDTIQFTRRSLADSEFVQSQDFDTQKSQISQRWRSVMNADAPESRQLKSDVEKLGGVVEEFQTALGNEQRVQRLRSAFDKFGKDVAKVAAEGTAVAMTDIPWIWKDILNVYLPLALEYIKSIPIPRTEFRDDVIEFVAENISIESLRLLPGHARLSTTINVDVDKPSGPANAETDVSHRTHLKLTGVQMGLKDVSFWYRDPSLKLTPEVSGLMSLGLPPRGVDIDVVFGLLPTLSGRRRRERKQGFHHISEVRVDLSSDTAIDLKKTNHPILITAFKPVVKELLIDRVEKLIAQQIRMVLEMMDGIAWDIHQRAEVFADTGLTGTGPKYVAAALSEWGKLKKQPGLLSGWTMTSLGLVKDDPRSDTILAVGAGPQIISGDKHGPGSLAPKTSAAQQSAKSAAQDAKGAAQQGTVTAATKVKSLKQSVDAKVEEEKQSGGWRSAAFDITSK